MNLIKLMFYIIKVPKGFPVPQRRSQMNNSSYQRASHLTVNRWVSHVQQELLTLMEHLQSPTFLGRFVLHDH